MPVQQVKVRIPGKGSATMYRMPTGPGHYFVKPPGGPTSDCGQRHVIAFLMAVSRQWFHPMPPFGIGDIFMVEGHESHFMGTAVDISVIAKNGVEQGRYLPKVTWNGPGSDNYDREATIRLARVIARNVMRFGGSLGVMQCFYNDPEVQSSVMFSPGFTTKLVPSHDDHIHLTFRQSQLPDWELNTILDFGDAAQDVAQEYAEWAQGFLADPRPLVYGWDGPTVERLQAILNDQGASQFAPLDVDGAFGPKTLARVQEFQRRKGLLSDGIVGPMTKKALADKYK